MSQHDAAWRRYKLQNDVKARDELILEFSYLARYVVDRMCIHASGIVGYDDLLSYAVIGLIDAVDRFDPSREVKFQTYAISRIRGAVLDALKSLGWIPRSVREAGRELSRAMAELEADLGHAPSDRELAIAMGLSIDELNALIADTGRHAMLSLEELTQSGEEFVSDRGLASGTGSHSDPILTAEIEEIKELLARAIGELPERERLVISLYYKEGLTFKEIAQVLGFTESRACQIHSKAVIRLHGKLERHADLMLVAA